MAKIPDNLKSIASDLGCNVINYITTTREGEVFSLAQTDEEGNYLPIGLPIVYACMGVRVTRLDDNRAIEILSKIPE